MAFNYQNLDEKTRGFMVEEIDRDIASQNIYIGRYLIPAAENVWPKLIRKAAQKYDDKWLASQIIEEELLIHFARHKAELTLAEGEFNRYYIRGLCLRAIEEGIERVVVYRARDSEIARYESESKIDLEYDPAAILDDLRNSVGKRPSLGIPPGPNSGISVRLP